jgi:hypothetical protein
MNTETNNTNTDNSSTIRAIRPRSHCKIARLPADVRETINQSIADNAAYPEIIARLETIGHAGITTNNLSDWAHSGFLIWRRHHERLELLRLQSEANCDLIRELESSDPTVCSRVNNLFLAGQLAQLMEDLDLDVLKQQMQSEPATFFRLVRSINAQTRNTFRHQRLQADLARQQTLLVENDQRASGPVRSTTTEAGYAAIAEEFGLPPRFSKQLPATPQNDQTSTETQTHISS